MKPILFTSGRPSHEDLSDALISQRRLSAQSLTKSKINGALTLGTTGLLLALPALTPLAIAGLSITTAITLYRSIKSLEDAQRCTASHSYIETLKKDRIKEDKLMKEAALTFDFATLCAIPLEEGKKLEMGNLGESHKETFLRHAHLITAIGRHALQSDPELSNSLPTLLSPTELQILTAPKMSHAEPLKTIEEKLSALRLFLPNTTDVLTSKDLAVKISQDLPRFAHEEAAMEQISKSTKLPSIDERLKKIRDAHDAGLKFVSKLSYASKAYTHSTKPTLKP